MDQERDVTSLRAAMQATRQSIDATVDELGQKVREAMDWRTYVNRYPATCLMLAISAGVLGGRRVAGWVGMGAAGGLASRRPPGQVVRAFGSVLMHQALPSVLSRLAAGFRRRAGSPSAIVD